MNIIKKTILRAIIFILCITLAGGLLSENLSALAESTRPPGRISSNLSPIAEDLELSTFRNVPVTGRFAAADPEYDALTFEIVTPPRRGEVVLDEDGTFIYTPRERYRGRDSFTYVAVDAVGNISPTATVRINVKRQSGQTSYADMDGNSAAYAALVLAENGVFSGETLGDRQFFRPDMPVTRGEFLAMSLKTLGADTLTGVTRTGFYDDESIPMWIKPYVSTALLSGIIRGYRNTDGNLVFSPNSPVTFSEAAVILGNLLDISDTMQAIYTGATYSRMDYQIPYWAYTAAANLYAADIIPGGISGISGDYVTRADAAKMLLASYNFHTSQDAHGRTLLGWAR